MLLALFILTLPTTFLLLISVIGIIATQGEICSNIWWDILLIVAVYVLTIDIGIVIIGYGIYTIMTYVKRRK